MNYFEEAAKAGVQGFWHCQEYADLIELARDKTVLEIGGFKGMSAWGMAHTAKSVLTVDTFKANTSGLQQLEEYTTLDDYIKAVGAFDHVSFFVGTSEKAAQELQGTWELIFIDAEHTYSAVKNDIGLWWPRVAMGGYLILHDYGHPDFEGVARAADEVFGPAEPGMRVIEKTMDRAVNNL